MPRDDLRPEPAASTRRRTSRYTNDPISLGLRKLWQKFEQEAVPAEFLDLLDAIDAASSAEAEPADAAPAAVLPGEKA